MVPARISSSLSSHTEISSSRSSSRRIRNRFARSACSRRGSTWSSSSAMRSLIRTRFSSVRSRRRSVSSFRWRYLLMPAASSKISRRSALRVERISSMRPWPMMA